MTIDAVLGLGKAGTDIVEQLIASGSSVRGVDFVDPAGRREAFGHVPDGAQLQLMQVHAGLDEASRCNVAHTSKLLILGCTHVHVLHNICTQGDATDAQSVARCLEGVSRVVLAFQGKSYFSAGRVDEGVPAASSRPHLHAGMLTWLMPPRPSTLTA